MKRLVLPVIMALALPFAGSAKLTVPSYLVSDFAGEFKTGISWQSYGVNDTPAGTYAEYFKRYSATRAYEILSIGQEYVAFSPSQFTSDITSDQWLITPEVEIPADNVIVSFAPSTYGSRLKNTFKALLSTGGPDKADFTTEIVSSNMKGNGAELTSIQRAHAISGYKGEKIRIALVAYGNTAGMFGFRNVMVGPYYLNVENADEYEDIVLNRAQGKLSMTVSMATVSEVKGFTAVLQTSTGYTASYVSTTTFSNPAITSETFSFPGKIDLGAEITADYTVTITPNFDGAEPSVLTGRMTLPELLYTRPAVIEELTGTWCQWCPYGYALMEFLQHKYPQGASTGPCYGIAVHNGDGMSVSAIDKATQNMAKPLGMTGLPSMMVNRRKAYNPVDAPSPVKSIVTSKSFLKTEIDRVDYNPESRTGKVNFSTTLSYPSKGNKYRVLVYVTQNAMSNPEWEQANKLYTLTSAEIGERFGYDAVEYFKPFIDGAPNPVTDLEYPDVARAVYPSYEGADVTYDFEAKTPIADSLLFELPAGIVTEVTNAVVTLILTDAASGEILAADRVAYADFNTEWESLAEVAVATTKIYAAEGLLMIEADEAVTIDVYATDGRKLLGKQLSAGLNVVDLHADGGVVIVKARGASGVTTAKIAL